MIDPNSGAARRTVAAAVLDLLSAQGVEVVFGLPGVHNLPFWDALGRQRPRIVGVRHEQAAVYAADALCRTGHGPGVAVVTSGPGAANAVAAFGEAAASGSGVVVIASEAPLDSRGRPRRGRIRHGLLHETTDQAALFSSLGDAVSVGSPGEALRSVADALERAATGPVPTTPSYVGIPSDVLSMPSAMPLPVSVGSAPRERPAGVAVAADLLSAARRPVVWVGGGVSASGAESAVTALVDALGAVVVTTFAGRGCLAAHPATIHAPVHEPLVAEVLAAADALVVVGSGYDAMNTRGWTLPVPERVVVVDAGSDAGAVVNLVSPRVHRITGPPGDCAELADAVRARRGVGTAPDAVAWQARAAALSSAVREGLHTDPCTAQAIAFVEAVETGWAASGAVIVDMCVAGYWVGGYARQPRPQRLVYPVGWGTLGFGPNAALGPAAAGQPTLAVCGDGGFAMAVGELATAAQERLPVTWLVVDDASYGMLRFDQQVFGHPERGVDLLSPDWAMLAGAYGVGVAEVPDEAGLAAALRIAYEANVRGQPRMVVLRAALYPPRTTSPRWNEPE